MGIKGLPGLIHHVSKSAMKEFLFPEFKGLKVAVDGNLMIHQSVIAIRSSGKDMMNEKGEITSHLHGLFHKILAFLQNDMVPIFVFDGKSPNIKNKVLEKRLKRRKDAEKQLKELGETEGEEYIKHYKQTFRLSQKNMDEALILLDLMGIPYIIAPEEADVVCAWLAARNDPDRKRYVSGVCSDDSDMLVLGAPYLFKNMLKFMNRNKEITVINLNKTLVGMNLTMDQFRDMSVMLGCDYCDNFKGVGQIKAYKLIHEYKTLEKVIESGVMQDPAASDENNEDKASCMIAARNYYKNALKQLDNSNNFVLTDDNLYLRQFQHKELLDFMCTKHNFDIIRIQAGIERLKDYYQRMNITRPNAKKVHKIIDPDISLYSVSELSDNIEFLPSSSDEEYMPMPSKKKSLYKKNNEYDEFKTLSKNLKTSRKFV